MEPDTPPIFQGKLRVELYAHREVNEDENGRIPPPASESRKNLLRLIGERADDRHGIDHLVRLEVFGQ